MSTLIIILFSINYLCLLLVMRWIIDAHESLNDVEKKINHIQHQIDYILCDNSIVNQNVLNTYGMLSEMKDKITNE